MTMSIAARCPETGMLGVAVASSSIAVASRCVNVRAGVGAALSQNVTDPSLGRRALDLMQSGASAQDVVAVLLSEHRFMAAAPARANGPGIGAISLPKVKAGRDRAIKPEAQALAIAGF